MNKATKRLTMAQALVLFLNNQYIDIDGEESKFVHGVMGIFGHGNAVGLGQALHQYKDQIRFIQGKNEQDIAHACMAYAKQNRRRAIYACTASVGPGALNLVTAAGNATVNKIPLLLLPADTFADRQPDPVLQQVENEMDYTVTANHSFKAVSRFWDRVSRPEQLMTACINAMRVLTDPELTGAVTLCLPQDVQAENYEYPEEFLSKRVWHIDRQPASQAAIERAADLIAAAKKPFIIAGGGVRYSDAGQLVAELATRFNIPVSETQAGKGEIASDHLNYTGCVGICGTQAANELMKEADLILAIGTKLNDFVTNSKGGLMHPDIPLVSINVSRMDALKMGSCSVVADAREGVVALTQALAARQYQSSYTSEISDAKQRWAAVLDQLSQLAPEEGLSQTRVLLELNQLLGTDDVIIAASGSLPSDLERVWTVKAPGTYHLEYGFSCMGYEIAGALGVKMAEPDKNVFVFVGDGGFLMTHSNLVTSLQERQKMTILLFNNNGHQCIHNLQRSQGIDTFGTVFRYREEETGDLTGDYVDIDFIKVAEGYGAKTFRARTIDELKQAVAASRLETQTTLIEISVLPGTMTEGYANFWRVGTASVSESEAVHEAYQRLDKTIQTIRKY
jgi:3D-(3,5/4)-trihydroxycyclohexane-1,2-dione acylhydrolase (decyclizing)